jgi:hypothetical protein
MGDFWARLCWRGWLRGVELDRVGFFFFFSVLGVDGYRDLKISNGPAPPCTPWQIG